MNTGRGNSIHSGGGLQLHFAMLGIDWALFIHMAEVNWVAPTETRRGHYRGIKTIARILGVSDASVIKWLKVYDKEIGRTQIYDKQKQE